jgi:microcompartment protein CcmK/EutM
MQLAKVIGRVVCTAKNESLTGLKMLVIQPITVDATPIGKPLIALDAVGAGAGEIVFWCRGRESSFPFLPREVPTDCTIVAIVDTIHAQRHRSPQ